MIMHRIQHLYSGYIYSADPGGTKCQYTRILCDKLQPLVMLRVQLRLITLNI